MATKRAEQHELRDLRYSQKLLKQQVERAQARSAKLDAAIRAHHRRVIEQEDWSADDDLWAVLALAGRPETKAA